VGDRFGWRLPTVEELASLVDDSTPLFSLALPDGHPFSNVQTTLYWSATTFAPDTSKAWRVSFNQTGTPQVDRNAAVAKSSAGGGLVWCVRGGQGIDGVQ
jgi:hypothetical protein